MTRELPFDDKEIEAYLDKLRTLEDRQQFIFTHLYYSLDVLDNKTNSMIQFSSVIFAIYIAVTVYADDKDVLKGFLLIPLVIGATFSAIALLFFLMVEKVYWSSLTDISDKQLHARRLLGTRDKRTKRYRFGWLCSVTSTVVLILTVVVVAIVTTPARLTE